MYFKLLSANGRVKKSENDAYIPFLLETFLSKIFPVPSVQVLIHQASASEEKREGMTLEYTFVISGARLR